MNFATDENFDGDMLRGLWVRFPDLNIVRIQDTEMYQAPDPKLLDWLAQENRVLLTHDINTMPGYVYDRVREGKRVIGVIAVHQDTPIGQALDDLELIIGAGTPDDLENQVRFVPIR